MALESHKFHVLKRCCFHKKVFPFASFTKERSRPLFQSPIHASLEDDSYLPSGQESQDLPSSSQQLHTRVISPQPEQRKAMRAHKRPDYWEDYVCCSTTPEDQCFCLSTLTNLFISTNRTVEVTVTSIANSIVEPSNFTKAVSHPGWQGAMDKEL